MSNKRNASLEQVIKTYHWFTRSGYSTSLVLHSFASSIYLALFSLYISLSLSLSSTLLLTIPMSASIRCEIDCFCSSQARRSRVRAGGNIFGFDSGKQNEFHLDGAFVQLLLLFPPPSLTSTRSPTRRTAAIRAGVAHIPVARISNHRAWSGKGGWEIGAKGKAFASFGPARVAVRDA